MDRGRGRGRGGVGVGVRQQGEDATPHVNPDDPTCAYCKDTTDEELHACISYDDTCRATDWHGVAAWVKNAKPTCDLRLHLSCARKDEENRTKCGGGDVSSIDTAKYQEIGFCRPCFTTMESNRE